MLVRLSRLATIRLLAKMYTILHYLDSHGRDHFQE